MLTRANQQGHISLVDVNKYYGSYHALKRINLEIHAGSVTVIIGPSGSGKSTLLRTINHLEPIDHGWVKIDDEYIGYREKGDKLYQLKERAILKQRTQVGYVFQNFNLFPHLTALENVAEAPIAHQRLSRKQAAEQALELLDQVGLKDKAGSWSRHLSGGQQQRVAIARALALNPKVLLFDEPTSALDPELVEEVLSVIRQIARSGKTLVIVTHEIAFARQIADQVVFMVEGEIIEHGPVEQVLNAPQQVRTRHFLASVL